MASQFPYRSYCSLSHPSEDSLEVYAIKRTSESETAEVEEHLLICEWCRVRLTEIDQFVATARVVLAEA